jgi:hypothetical protein
MKAQGLQPLGLEELTMAKIQAPVVLELAPLPREQVGPFLILGLDKTADKDVIEANWAQRVVWARRNQAGAPLEDVNWARETINDLDKRIRADAASLNLDTTEGALRQLADKFGGARQEPGCQPLDVEKPLANYTPPTEVPDLNEVRNGLTIPEVPRDIPAVQRILEQFLQQPFDPWTILPNEGPRTKE